MEEPIIINHHEALLEMCLRNALRLARGEIHYTLELGDQLQFAYKNSSGNTRKILKSVFRDLGILD